jgi:4-hydroxy-tetrahydrodipicolinate reductase
MGGTIIKEAPSDKFEITGAVAAQGEAGIGKSLKEQEVADLDLKIESPESLGHLLEISDVCLSFTSVGAELKNLSTVINSKRPFVLGTTGFSKEQGDSIVRSLDGNLPTVMAPNFSIGANMLFAMASTLKVLPTDFDVSVMEMHHSGKADAPSGTARTIADIVSTARGYSKTVYGRSGMSKRLPGELEISSFRGGGMPGEHAIFAFGPHEMLKLEHVAFSRSAFSQGALVAAAWLATGRAPKVYSMLDVLGFRL